ncbi:preprotein translocase subunit SecE [Permianibacter sp. IMCC34836]|uniref:preprotein translocase subunit SecE n=1 Tax=Permianibacter fluminis TaxID=2738515 RepID=UPI001552DAA3|nr:preprotein translocase subunit SecE [Permianibacter fluminis]NQD38397.1 preprotein translocase subunit SecE [Permianibacter fluminis]
MTTNVEQTPTRLDSLKWILVAFLIAVAVVGNQYFVEQAWYFRAIGVIVALAVAAVVALQTQKGRDALEFAKEARTEIRKVVWPTRQETVQTTIIVAIFVVVIALFLWLVDWLLVWALGFIIA